jgi:CBS domain-containing protein
MVRYRVGRIVIVNEASRPVGIVTRSDFLKIAGSSLARRSLDTIPAEKIMTRDPVVIEAGKSLRDAARLMLQYGVSSLPVVDEKGVLVGIVTKTDIIRAYAERLRGRYKASDYMYTDPPVASPTHSIAYVIDLLESHPSRRVLVVDGEKLVGIIAPSDIAFTASSTVPSRGKEKYVRRFAILPKGRLGPVYDYMMTTAADVMTPDPVTASPEDDLAAVAQAMIRGGFSSVPVVEGEKPVGLVVKHNILEAIVGR